MSLPKMKLHQLGTEHLQKYQNNTAVVFDDGKMKSHITYEEMLGLSSKLTVCFADHFSSGEVIGLCLKSDHYLPVILLSVLRRDAAFYNMGIESLAFARQVLEELGVRFVIVHRDFSKEFIKRALSGKTWKEVSIPSLDAYVMYKFESVAIRSHRHDLAYCITTSGTTGSPKIVKVPHACIIPNITHLREIFNITSDDLVLLSSPLTFDPSIVEIFMTLSSGACLLIVPENVKMSPDLLLNTVHQRNKVTVVQMTPALLRRFQANILPNTLLGDNSALRVMALGGEQFPPPSLMRKLRSSDNSTRLFNLYGTTEVSSWATCYEVTGEDLEDEGNVPIGGCLKDTLIEVRDSDGIVTAGVGELYIGGTYRQCILGPEEEESFDGNRVKMRATGDIVERRADGQIYCLCRTDRQVKRCGKRVNLEEIKLVANAVCNIHSEVIVASSRLVLFAVMDDYKRTATGVDGDAEDLIKAQMSTRLPSHSVPDDVVMIESLPMTKHGKVDLKKLEAQFTDQLQLKKYTTQVDVLTQKWKELLGVDSPVTEDSNFISTGGNSLRALHLLNEIENTFNRKLPDLLDIILQKTFFDVKEYIVCKQKDQIFGKGNKEFNPIETSKADKVYVDSKDAKRIVLQRNYTSEERNDYTGKPRSGTYKRKKSTDINDKPKVPRCTGTKGFHTSVSRGSKVVKIASSTDYDAVSEDIGGVADNGIIDDSDPGLTGIDIHLRENWTYDTGKCVDASPLIAISSEPEGDVVYIGSHSHTMCAIVLSSGEQLWEITLPDRVESSACLSLCGKFVIVGCYDGRVYCLKADSGNSWWSHDTGAEVKSSPAVDRVTGLVYIGSHSQTLHCLDVENRTVAWEAGLQAGSIFSSPTVWYDPHCVCVGTLGCKVLAVCAKSGSVLWQTSLGRPVFASVAMCNTGLCVGCTDNTLYFLSHSGEKIWSFTTEGPMFSSPVIFSISRHSTHGTGTDSTENNSNELIVIGCHDNNVYCLSLKGELVWKFATNSSVYSTPFAITVKVQTVDSESQDLCHTNNNTASALSVAHKSLKVLGEQRLPVVAFSSSKGSLYLVHASTGAALAMQELPYEVFSSAVVYRNDVIVGCRDNFVYSFSLEAVRSK